MLGVGREAPAIRAPAIGNVVFCNTPPFPQTYHDVEFHPLKTEPYV